MRLPFSTETKRNIGIMVAVGTMIAMIAGTLALHERVFGENEDDTLSAPQSVAKMTPEGTIPAEVLEWFSKDLGTLGEPYPVGAKTPQVADLLPQTKGSQLVSEDATSITLAVPSKYVEPESQNPTSYVVYQRGDMAVLEALYWRCGWAKVHVEVHQNGGAGETQKAREARMMLARFPTLNAVEGLPVARNHEKEMVAVLKGGQEGQQWLVEKCGVP